MFALKFKQWGWKGNEVKYIFLITCIPLVAIFGISSFAIMETIFNVFPEPGVPVIKQISAIYFFFPIEVASFVICLNDRIKAIAPNKILRTVPPPLI